MATQPHTDKDLDRTDELPRLDVAAYEAKLAAEADDTLASTDAWAAETMYRDPDATLLRQPDTTLYRDPDATRIHDTAAFAKRTKTRVAPPEKTSTTEVTLDATRILGRIAQLEEQIGIAKGQHDELQARFDRVSTELSAKDREVRALNADNARIQEQRSLVLERLQNIEQQLKEATEQHEQDITLERQARANERNAAQHAQAAFEAQVAELTTLATRLRKENARLDEETQGATKLAQTQTELIEHFKQRLHSEEKNSAQLARHLASKIAEHSSVNHEIERRDATIRTLEALRADLTQDLDTLRETHEALRLQLASTNEQLASERASVAERQALLTARDTRIDELTSELSSAQTAITALSQERDRLTEALANEREARSQTQLALSTRAQELDRLRSSSESLQARIATLEQELTEERASRQENQRRARETERALTESQARGEALTNEVNAVRAHEHALEAEVQQLQVLRESLAARAAEAQRTEEELNAVREEIASLHSELIEKQNALDERDEATRAARDVVMTLQRKNEELEQQAASDRHRLAELEANERTREESVLANAAELAAVRRQLGQQLATVQSMEQVIRARDTLAERLRGELQTSQDERGIMAAQLEKSRARNKSMARELFARDAQIASLKADLAVHVETLAAIRQDVNRASATAELPIDGGDRVLEPVDHDGDVILLDKKLMTIGRTSDNDICVPSKLVSRNHARLLIGPNAVILEDAGSTNGCYVNDLQVKQHLLREGDVLSLGDLKYRLVLRAENATRSRGNIIPFADTRQNE